MVDGMTLALGTAATMGIVVAAAGGYSVGYRSAATAPARLIRRAGRDSERCLSEAAAAIDVAGRLCDAVAGASAATERQIATIAERHDHLAEALSRLRMTIRTSDPAAAAKIEWNREPLDAETELPNRSAFEANIEIFRAQTKNAPLGGVLFISLDDAVRLRKRVGEGNYRNVCQSVARVLCRAGRELDLACRIDGETFALLMPDPDPHDALDHANAVRDTFRKHPFRLGPDGPECLVTASFGFTPVLASDESRLIMDRARAAVSRSRRWGRNRLHGYDPAGRGFSLIKHTSLPTEHRPAAAAPIRL